MGPHVMRGLGYLASALDESTLSALREAGGGPRPFLWFTSRDGTPSADDAEVVRVLPGGGANGADARRPQDLRARVAGFLEGREGGIVIVDCADLLATQSGAERAVRGLQDLHEEVASRGAVLVVLLDPRTTSARMLAWLEREFETLPGVALDRVLAASLPT